jgi:hypothetical protein
MRACIANAMEVWRYNRMHSIKVVSRTSALRPNSAIRTGSEAGHSPQRHEHPAHDLLRATLGEQFPPLEIGFVQA